jgi:hypothetical protein
MAQHPPLRLPEELPRRQRFADGTAHRMAQLAGPPPAWAIILVGFIPLPRLATAG